MCLIYDQWNIIWLKHIFNPTDISSNDDLYILQAKDEEAEKEILKTFRDYLNTDVMDRRFFNVANNYIFPHTIIANNLIIIFMIFNH